MIELYLPLPRRAMTPSFRKTSTSIVQTKLTVCKPACCLIQRTYSLFVYGVERYGTPNATDVRPPTNFGSFGYPQDREDAVTFRLFFVSAALLF